MGYNGIGNPFLQRGVSLMGYNGHSPFSQSALAIYPLVEIGNTYNSRRVATGTYTNGLLFIELKHISFIEIGRDDLHAILYLISLSYIYYRFWPFSPLLILQCIHRIDHRGPKGMV